MFKNLEKRRSTKANVEDTNKDCISRDKPTMSEMKNMLDGMNRLYIKEKR